MIFVDMDGVLCDFESGIFDLYGGTRLDDFHSEFWGRDVKDKQFFSRLAPMGVGTSMLRDMIFCEYPVSILTSTGTAVNHHDIIVEKLRWLSYHGFGDLPVAFCSGTYGKGPFAHKDALLIDDREIVRENFRENGGHSVGITEWSDAVKNMLLMEYSNCFEHRGER